MKKILFSLMTVVLVFGMVGAGAFAYFSDIETSTANVFTAGTLNLVPDTAGTGPAGKITVTAGGDGINGNVVFANLAPGESGNITWTLVNDGTLDGLFNATIHRLNDSDVTIVEPEDMADTVLDGADGTVDGDLDDNMNVLIEADLDGDGVYETIILALALGSLETYVECAVTNIVLNDPMPAEDGAAGGIDTVSIRLTWDIPAATGNIIQSDTVQLDLVFTLE